MLSLCWCSVLITSLELISIFTREPRSAAESASAFVVVVCLLLLGACLKWPDCSRVMACIVYLALFNKNTV